MFGGGPYEDEKDVATSDHGDSLLVVVLGRQRCAITSIGEEIDDESLRARG